MGRYFTDKWNARAGLPVAFARDVIFFIIAIAAMVA
jgi:hypothetical protein